MSDIETPPAEAGSRSDNMLVVAVVVAFMALVVAAVGAGFAARAINDDDGDGGGGGGAATTASVNLSEFKIEPDAISVSAGGSIQATNVGLIDHDLAVEGFEDAKTPLIGKGQAESLSLAGIDPGEYTIYCTVPGHRDGGMEGQLTITEGGGGEVTSGQPGASIPSSELTPEEMDHSAHERMAEFPQETEGTGGEVLEPTVLPDGTKQYEITVDVIEWEVEKGKVVEAWAYNGQIPGPTLKVDSGDNVRVQVQNNLNESTTVHWHGIDVPNAMDGVPDVTQDQIKPGDTFTYEFTVSGPAVGMYHAHSNSQKQVPMGLSAGMLIAELPVPDGVEVSQEIPFIVNDGGELGFTINGKAFPATKPITAKVGETILVHYFNEGLQVHPMHLHGPMQTIIAKDGNPLPQPYKADTVLVGPGERYSVLVTPNRPGVWVWHCHILTHAEAPEGFIGMTTALVVEE